MMAICPHCAAPLEGLGFYCWTCKRYTANTTATTTIPAASTLPDARSEDERKQDAREAVEALGWWIIDTEQGYRPHHCPKCQNKIPGGTRTTLGLADWLCLRNGVAAFIEWKSADGRQSAHQMAFQGAADAARIPYRMCRTTEQAVGFLQEVGA